MFNYSFRGGDGNSGGDLGARGVEAKRCLHDGVVEAQIVPPHPPRVIVLRDLATPPLGLPYSCILPR